MLNKKIFLITGASHGLGKACAKFCANAGAQVILLSSNEKALEQCYDEIIALNKQKPLICTFDLASATANEYQLLKNTIEEKYHVLDGLIHCAGQLKSLTPLEHTPLHQWHQLIQINLNARFALNQTLLPLLKCSPKAHLSLLLSDRAFETGSAYWGTYQVSEKANLAMFEILCQELKESNVQVNAIHAPNCNTKLRKQAFPFEENANLLEPQQLDDLWQKCFDDKTQHGEVISYKL